MTGWNDKDQVIKAVSEDGMLLKNDSDGLRVDREGKYWFEKHTRSDFTKYALIDSYINRAYWTASKYNLLIESVPLDTSQAFIQKHRSSIEGSLKTAGQYLSNWNNIPTDIKIILITTLENAAANIKEIIELTDSTIFHKKLGLEKKETNWIEDFAERDRNTLKTYSQYTDNYNLVTLYHKWVYLWYGSMLNDDESTHIFLTGKNLNKLISLVPKKSIVERAAIAEAKYIEVRSSTNSHEFVRKYTHEWVKVFLSASMMTEAVRDFILSIDKALGLKNQGRDPNICEPEKEFDEAIDKAAFMQHDSMLALADLIISELKDPVRAI